MKSWGKAASAVDAGFMRWGQSIGEGVRGDERRRGARDQCGGQRTRSIRSGWVGRPEGRRIGGLEGRRGGSRREALTKAPRSGALQGADLSLSSLSFSFSG